MTLDSGSDSYSDLVPPSPFAEIPYSSVIYPNYPSSLFPASPPDTMATNGTTTNGSSDTHTQSQRYLSTRGEDSGVSLAISTPRDWSPAATRACARLSAFALTL